MPDGPKQKSQRSTVLGGRCTAAGDWLSVLASTKSKEMAELCESGLVWWPYCPYSSADGGPVAFSNAALTSTFSPPRPPFFSTVGALSIGSNGVLTLVSARYYPEGTSCSSVSPKPAVSPETTPRSVLCTFSTFIYSTSSTSRELDEVIFRVSRARRRSLISSLNAEHSIRNRCTPACLVFLSSCFRQGNFLSVPLVS